MRTAYMYTIQLETLDGQRITLRDSNFRRARRFARDWCKICFGTAWVWTPTKDGFGIDNCTIYNYNCTKNKVE